MSEGYTLPPEDFINAARDKKWDIFWLHVEWYYHNHKMAFDDALKWVIAHDKIDVFHDIFCRYPMTLKTSHKRVMLLTDSIQILGYLYKNNHVDKKTFSSHHYSLLIKNHSYNILYFFLKHELVPLSSQIKSNILHAPYDDDHLPGCCLCAQYVLKHAEFETFDTQEYEVIFENSILIYDAIDCLVRTNFVHFCEKKPILNTYLGRLGLPDYDSYSSQEKSTLEECSLFV